MIDAIFITTLCITSFTEIYISNILALVAMGLLTPGCKGNCALGNLSSWGKSYTGRGGMHSQVTPGTRGDSFLRRLASCTMLKKSTQAGAAKHRAWRRRKESKAVRRQRQVGAGHSA
jgi:hypothetical protein